ncbi:uncharacterized protein LOC143869772 [Tasmannia lanceolata]|uniref:uncharacterized protein LOC143869772 n=1 Tax=Tasmannia lanceolata TaxID=3420 RepID=UPI0040630313
MECNKEEAIRAKGIAEKKMLSKDFLGARKIVLKAQQLFPDLENISQMLTVCDVHCSAELKGGMLEMDWYGILQVEHNADEVSIKKQYRKLALLLHPDKNKFAGAEAAFKLIGEAQRVLSDPTKRSLHDMKRKIATRNPVPRQPPQPKSNSNVMRPPVPNNFTGHFPPQQQQTQASFANGSTFWTICPFCGIKYQYYRSILDRALRCQSCLKPFIAHDMNVQGAPPGSNSAFPWNQFPNPQQKVNRSQDANKVGQQNSTGNSSGAQFQGNVTRGAPVPPPFSAENKVKVEVGNSEGPNRRSQTVKHSQNAKPKKRRKVSVESSESCGTDSKENDQNAEATSSRYTRRSVRQNHNVTYNEGVNDDDDFANPPSSKRSRNFGSFGVAGKDGAVSENDASKTKETPVSEESLPNGKEEAEKYEKNGSEQAGVDEEKESSKDEDDLEPIVYPEPEFYDFDKSRKEENFAVGQIWALYDNSGGMPRFYARISKLRYSPEFKLKITWLEFIPNFKDENEVNWADADLPIGCGNFKHGGSDDDLECTMFSHLVSWEKGTLRRTYKIYPRKGDIWALFKGWDIKWSSTADKHKQYEYVIVEVLSEYAEGTGVKVLYLFKVKGFTSLFQRRVNEKMYIPQNEMFRFSHKIPSYKVSGEERDDIPKGSFELDPLSVPNGLEEFPPSSLSGNVKVDVEIMDEQTNGSSYKYASVKETPEKCDEPIEKNVREEEKVDNGVCSRIMNGVYEKKHSQANTSQCLANEGINLESVKGCLDGFPDNKPGEPSAANCRVDDTKTSPSDAIEGHNSIPSAYDCPDPEFHNFERNIHKFQLGQIWAVYSDEDGLPKYYARIRSVVLSTSKVHVTWLEARPMSEEETRWSHDLPAGCGTFRIASTKKNLEIDSFSHQVKAMPASEKNTYEIFPREGEIWAIYKNWSRGEALPDLDNCEYEMVEVLKDTNSGFKVIGLVKVEGYNSVFKQDGATKEISRDELLKFSHQVPVFRLTEEKGGKLRGYFELDPASVPIIFFCGPTN